MLCYLYFLTFLIVSSRQCKGLLQAGQSSRCSVERGRGSIGLRKGAEAGPFSGTVCGQGAEGAGGTTPLQAGGGEGPLQGPV